MFREDRFASAFLVGVAVIAISTTAIGAVEAEEPTAAQLIEGVRNLTTTDPELTAFSMRMTTSVPFEVPFETSAVWRKDGDVGLLTTAGDSGSPVWFLSNSRAAFFDVCTGSVLIKESGRLKLNLRFTGEALQLDYGIGSGDEHHVDVGFRPLLDHTTLRNGSLSRLADGDFVLESKVSPRGNRTFAVFDGKAPHSLRSLELKRVDGDVSVVRLHDIRLNDEVDVRWPRMPASDDFPDGIHIIDTAKDDDAPDSPTQVLWLIRSQIGYAGLREVKWRDVPSVAGVDWSEAMEHSRSLESLGAKLTAETVGDIASER